MQKAEQNEVQEAKQIEVQKAKQNEVQKVNNMLSQCLIFYKEA